MPGDPQKDFVNLENLELQVYADITTNLYYFTMGAIGKDVKNVDSLVRAMVKNIDKTATVHEVKDIIQDNIPGKEFVAKTEKLVYRIKLFYKSSAIYMAMVGCIGQDMTTSGEASKFFSSFKMNSNFIADQRKPQIIESNDAGFSITFPSKPTIKTEVDAEENWGTTNYSSADIGNNIFFQFAVQETLKGLYLNGDSIVFESMKKNMEDRNFKTITHNRTIFQKYPAAVSEFILKQDGETYYNRILKVHRGNRMYSLIVTTEESKKHDPSVEAFFNSFLLTAVKDGNWSMVDCKDGGFSTWSAAKFELYRSKDSSESNVPHWMMYEPLAPLTFYVKKVGYPKLFWATNDTSLLKREMYSVIEYSDSLLDHRFVKNQNYSGIEFSVRMEDNHNLKKFRLLLVGDTLYTLFGIAPEEFLSKKDYLRYFEDFKPAMENPHQSIFEKKTDKWLAALQSKDSVQHSLAIESMPAIELSVSDLPKLHHAMLVNYEKLGYSEDISRSLFEMAIKLNHESSFRFVKDNFATLPTDKEFLKFEMMHLLAKQKSPEAYQYLAKIIKSGLPKSGNPFRLFNDLSDSLSFAAILFPDLISQVRDTILTYNILNLAEKLLDSGDIKVEELAVHKKLLYQLADNYLLRLKADEEPSDWYTCHTLISILGKLNEAEGYSAIRKFLSCPNHYLSFTAAKTLLGGMQTVDAASLLKLASYNEHRLDLFKELASNKKESLFPKQYLSQQSFAESEIYSISTYDEVENPLIKFIGTRNAVFKGEKKTFYLFRIDVNMDDAISSYLGIAGPYSSNDKYPSIEGEATGIEWEKTFSLKSIDLDLKTYLKETEARLAEYEKYMKTVYQTLQSNSLIHSCLRRP